MTFSITLNVKDAAEAALKAYNEGRLSAQGDQPACQYRDAIGRPCAIGAALNEEQVEKLISLGKNEISVDEMSVDEGDDYVKVFQSDNIQALSALQSAHDSWAQAVKNERSETEILACKDYFVKAVHKELAK